jgi:hypothetical protein
VSQLLAIAARRLSPNPLVNTEETMKPREVESIRPTVAMNGPSILAQTHTENQRKSSIHPIKEEGIGPFVDRCAIE